MIACFSGYDLVFLNDENLLSIIFLGLLFIIFINFYSHCLNFTKAIAYQVLQEYYYKLYLIKVFYLNYILYLASNYLSLWNYFRYYNFFSNMNLSINNSLQKCGSYIQLLSVSFIYIYLSLNWAFWQLKELTALIWALIYYLGRQNSLYAFNTNIFSSWVLVS